MPQTKPNSPTAARPTEQSTNADASGSSGAAAWLRFLLAKTPLIVVHLAVLGALWSGVTWSAVIVCLVLYTVRMFAVTAGYHRYFAHRTYRTSRAFQFVLAWLAQTSSQRGVLWWAAHHRDHHRTSDTPDDLHSPIRQGFWHAHIGWVYDPRAVRTKLERVPDLALFPELRWLDRHWWVPATSLAVVITVLFGWSGLFIGYCLSTVLVWHATFSINSVAHMFGQRPYDTKDTSRNNWLLALITFGEGWHNNHHRYPRATRQGWRWYEVDFTYYGLKVLSWLGLVWDLKGPPAAVLASRRVDPEAPVAAPEPSPPLPG